MSHIKEMKDLTEEQLEAMLADLKHEIYDLKCKLAAARKLEKPHLLKEKKRDLSRVLFVLAEKKRVKKQ